MAFAHWVSKSLVVQDDKGGIGPPGSGFVIQLRQPDDREFTVIARGEAFDLYIGKKTIYNFSITSRSAIVLAKWLLRWWIFEMWCGAKLALWEWSLKKIMTRKAHAAP